MGGYDVPSEVSCDATSTKPAHLHASQPSTMQLLEQPRSHCSNAKQTYSTQHKHPVLDLGFGYTQTFLGSRWPEELGPEWANTCLDFQAKTHKVAVMVLEALAIALHMDVQPFLGVGFSAFSNSIWTVGPSRHTCYPRFCTRSRRLGVVHRFLTIKVD